MRGSRRQIRTAVRELAATLYEAELRRALEELSTAFEQWKAGRLSSVALADQIHAFHQGPARDAFLRFQGDGAEIHVAAAIASGELDPSEVPEGVLEHLWPLVDWCRGPKD